LCPSTAAALTRAVLPFCLGRGSISVFSRSYNLSLQHPRERREVAWHQRSRLLAYLPRMKEPRWVPSTATGARQEAGWWRLRVANASLETAWRLLYHSGSYSITEEILEILGIDAIASLWADRGSLKSRANRSICTGRLNLVRHGFPSAQLIHDWIYTHTGVTGSIIRSPHSGDVPVIRYDTDAVEALMQRLQHTWYAKEETLRAVFRTPNRLAEEHWLQRSGVAPVIPQRQNAESPRPRELPVVPLY
jgi:hypothetical protein